MDLLTNAVESIQIGVEDYDDGSRPRLLSAVRNIHAGILLLYKEALLRRSPPDSNEALIKAKIEPWPDGSGGIIYVGVGKKTVDTQQIEYRFKRLGIFTDWKLLKSITDLRNDVEHYYFPNLCKEAIAGVVSSAFLIIRQFAVAELGENPLELLGQETWDEMLKASEVYNTERQECDNALAAIAWKSDALKAGVTKVRCGDCGSDLLKPGDGSTSFSDTTLECRSCGSVRDPDSFIPEALAEALTSEAYLTMTDGAEEPYLRCHTCLLETYVYAEDRCAHCGETAPECELCGARISSWEMASSTLCGRCYHVMSKDD